MLCKSFRRKASFRASLLKLQESASLLKLYFRRVLKS
jgi:hypothetical protein